MWDFVLPYWKTLLKSVDRMETTHWVVVCVVVLAIGAICMRGFGKRTNY